MKKIFIIQPMNGKTNGQIQAERKPYVDAVQKNGDEVIDSIMHRDTVNAFFV